MTRSAGPGIPRSGPLLAHDALRRTRGAGDCAEPVLGDLYMLKDLSFNGSRESPAFLNDLANSHEVLSLPPGTGTAAGARAGARARDAAAHVSAAW